MSSSALVTAKIEFWPPNFIITILHVLLLSSVNFICSQYSHMHNFDAHLQMVYPILFIMELLFVLFRSNLQYNTCERLSREKPALTSWILIPFRLSPPWSWYWYCLFLYMWCYLLLAAWRFHKPLFCSCK